MTHRPPPFGTSLLTRAMGSPQAADEIAGDLFEEFTVVVQSRGVTYARIWYVAQCAVLAVRALSGRVLAAERPLADPFGQPTGDPFMRSLLTDARHAVRGLGKRPALSALVILTLSLGLGANAAIFQVIDALILRPFTLREIDRLVLLAETAPQLQFDTQETVSPTNFLDWKTQTTGTFEQLSAFEWWDVNLAAEHEAERVPGFWVSANFFETMGVQPAMGRGFLPEEETRGNHRRVVLSHDLWERRFGADRAVIGTTVLLDSEPHEIIGVAPEGFDFPMGTAVWAPLAFDAKTAARRDARYLTVVGRLAPDRSLDDAKAQMALVGERLAQQYPEANKDRGARAMTLVQGMRDQGLGPMVVLWQASAAFVLLIACANIANLLLARSAERQREVAVRSALGATRGRIVRGMLVESVVLALAAVPVALAVAWVGISLIRANLPPRLIRFVAGWQTMDVDARLIAFTAILALFTAALFGMLPALRASRPILAQTLKEGGRGTSAGRQRQRLRWTLVVGEVALALPLLVASALCALGANRFMNGPQGYDPDGLFIMRAVLPEAKYPDLESRRQFAARIETRLAQLPGVESVGVSNVLPSTGNNFSRAIEVEGKPNPDPANVPRVDFRAVRPDFLETMRIPLMRGRLFTSADTADAQPVAIISQSTANRFFAGTDPVGQRVKLGSDEWVTVVGISGDTIHDWFAGRHRPTVYMPFDQRPSTYLAVALRASGDLESLVLPVRAAVREIDAAQPVFDAMPMRTMLSERTVGLRYVAGIMAVFGGLALLLAVVGVSSLMAFVITQRTHEIGVRMALGANRADVFRLTIGQAVSMAAVGVGIGLALSIGLTRVMESTLLGIVSADARVPAVLALVLVGAAMLAGYLPARRASAIDPIVALRE